METRQNNQSTKQNTEQNSDIFLLSNEIVQAAVSGDVDAINMLLNHCDRYLMLLSLCELKDDDGNVRLCLDMEKKRRLETKMIVKLLQMNSHNTAQSIVHKVAQ